MKTYRNWKIVSVIAGLAAVAVGILVTVDRGGRANPLVSGSPVPVAPLVLAVSVQGPGDLQPRVLLATRDGVVHRDLGFGVDVTWSPDCSQIAFSRMVGDTPRIFLVRPDGTGLRQITTGASVRDEEPAWSPDGTQIAFTMDKGAGLPRDVALVTVGDPSKVSEVTLERSDEFSPSWSPSGDELALIRVPSGSVDGVSSSRPGELNQVWILNLASHLLRRSTAMKSGAWRPAWSPSDGVQVVFDSGGGLFSVRTGPSRGRPPKELVSPVADAFDATWSSTGDVLLYLRNDSAGDALYLSQSGMGSGSPLNLSSTGNIASADLCDAG